MSPTTQSAASKTATPTKTYSTSRLDISAILLCHNIELVDAALADRHVQFVFADSEGAASDLADQHDRGALTVVSRRFSSSMDQARDLVFAARRAAGLAK